MKQSSEAEVPLRRSRVLKQRCTKMKQSSEAEVQKMKQSSEAEVVFFRKNEVEVAIKNQFFPSKMKQRLRTNEAEVENK